MPDNDSHRWISEAAEVLVREIEEEPEGALHCDVLIIGSGYGGAVAAARLAGATVTDEANRRACVYVLERGGEYLPGEFPATFAELPGHVRFSMQDGEAPRGNASGLFDLRIGGKVNALLGNGLGGGSLINAAVMERATEDAFASGWPAGIDRDALDAAYGDAEKMLGVEQIPVDVSKLDSLMAAGARIGAPEKRKAWVAIAFAPGRTEANVAMERCLLCGDCVSGCNHRAKKSLDTNYLALASARKARLFCGGTVHAVRALPGGAGYAVDFFFTDRRKARTDAARPYTVRARRVILAAGALGSTEILLRSHAAGLPVARDALGARFSANGDMIAVAHAQKRKALSSAREGDAPGTRGIGPTITGLVRTAAVKGKPRPVVIEEFAIPGPLRRLLAEVVTTTRAVHDLASRDNSLHHPEDKMLDPLAVDEEALERTPVYGMMGDDGAGGSVVLLDRAVGMTDGQVRVEWEDVAAHPVFKRQMAALHAAHEGGNGALGGRVLPNPLWNPLPPMRSFEEVEAPGSVTTVHPLGGCRMADSGAQGVVDGWGRVHAKAVAGQPPALLPGLAVLDGAIVPVSLGINPSLTIAALAERAIPVLAADWGLALHAGDAPAPSSRPLRRDLTRPKAPAATVLTMRERLAGPVRIGGKPFDLSATVEFAPFEVGKLRTLPAALKQQRVLLRFGDDPNATAECTGTALVLVRGYLAGVTRALRSRSLAIRKLRDFFGDAPPSKAQTHDVAVLLTHVGGFRTLQYDWTVVRAAPGLPVKARDHLRLTKTLDFAKGGNPWRQLTEGELERIGLFGRRLGTLTLDASFFAESLQPLVRVESQQDAPNQLGDLAELALWLLRVVTRIHLLNLLPPSDFQLKADDRLPGEVDGVEPQPVPLPVEESAAAEGKAMPRRLLSRYAPPKPRTGLRPVLLIHGFGASGSTFAHEAIGHDGTKPRNLVSALLDSGREVWVLDMRTSIGFDDRRYWSFDEVAQKDIPDGIDAVLREYPKGSRVDVVAHCIGSAMFSVAVLRSENLHERIGAVVLSQVGPMLRATAFNRFRGFVSSYLRQFINAQSFDTDAGRWSDGFRLLVDGILATFPYPDGDGESGRLATVPGFAAVRHRADAIFGRTMRLENIGDRMLPSLRAIYGHVNVQALAQVAHYAREQVLTDVGGQNQSVGFELLGERFRFPVLLVHGRHNAVFDWRGAFDSYSLLTAVFDKTSAGALSLAEEQSGNIERGLGTKEPRQLLVLGEYGHQDTLIGQDAHRDVFPRMVEFLDAFEALPAPSLPGSAPWTAVLPWAGPWLGRAERRAELPGLLLCRLGLRPPPAHVSARAVVFVPARRVGTRWEFDLARMVAAPADRDTLLAGTLTVHLRDAKLPAWQGFAVLTVHDDLPALGTEGGVFGTEADADNLFALPRLMPSQTVREAVETTLVRAAAEAGEGRDALDLAIVRLDPHWTRAVQREGDPPQASLCFALANGQGVPGLVDRLPAQVSYARLARRLAADDGTPRPQLLLLAGNQVVVDQTAGLFVPTGGDDVGQAYALNFRLPALRRVTARLPSYPLLNDREVRDDWEPSAEAWQPGSEKDALRAYVAWQHKLGRRKEEAKQEGDPDPRPFDHALAPAGLPFFMLDTRSLRERRALRRTGGATPLADAMICTEESMDALRKWLAAQPVDLPKFIVSPVPLAPMPRRAVFGKDPERLGLDDWSGYPASQRALLRLLRDSGARRVIVLSGDRQTSSVSSLWLEGAEAVEVVSIVSPALYAPWPAADSRPDAFWLDGAFEAGDAKGRIPTTMITAAVGTRGGFAIVGVERGESEGGGGGEGEGDAAVWTLNVTLDLEDGKIVCTRRFTSGADRAWTVTKQGVD